MICSKCGGDMKEGLAMQSTLVSGMPDFIGDKQGITLSEGGPGRLIPCLKCEECGYSITIGD